MIRVHSLTKEGVRLAYDLLSRIKSGESAGVDLDELTSAVAARDTTIGIAPPEPESVTSRWELAKWLHASLTAHEDHLDAGAWSWLAMCLFDFLCPAADGARKVRQFARYLLEANDFRKAH